MRYHYIITVQFDPRNGVQRFSCEYGVITSEPGQTRSDLFDRVFAQLRSMGANPIVLFFSLEPDEIKKERVRRGWIGI